jgi:hypothetical protein
MKVFRNTMIALGLILGGVAAQAADLVESRIVYQRKHWEVLVAAYDDASITCIARVEKPGSAFAIWADGDSAAQLQFWDNSWNFSGGAEDIVVQIDRRAKWDLTNADLDGQSVWFTLPNNNDAERFIREVAYGNTIKLFNNSGRLIDSWSLAGSLASINALIDCTDSLLTQADGNPFN